MFSTLPGLGGECLLAQLYIISLEELGFIIFNWEHFIDDKMYLYYMLHKIYNNKILNKFGFRVIFNIFTCFFLHEYSTWWWGGYIMYKTISSPSHILLIFSSEPPWNPCPSIIMCFKVSNSWRYNCFLKIWPR